MYERNIHRLLLTKKYNDHRHSWTTLLFIFIAYKSYILDFIYFNYVYIHTHTYQCYIVTVGLTAFWQLPVLKSMMMMMNDDDDYWYTDRILTCLSGHHVMTDDTVAATPAECIIESARSCHPLHQHHAASKRSRRRRDACASDSLAGAWWLAAAGLYIQLRGSLQGSHISRVFRTGHFMFLGRVRKLGDCQFI